MFTPAKPLHVDDHQRKRLKHLANSGKTPQKIALRARIVLRAGEGRPHHAMAKELGISRPTKWIAPWFPPSWKNVRRWRRPRRPTAAAAVHIAIRIGCI